MLPTIDLDDHAEFTANKVADVTADRHLPGELVPVDLPVSNPIP
jgi:hypothetical protein